mgnify:CR=1 FL=1
MLTGLLLAGGMFYVAVTGADNGSESAECGHRLVVLTPPSGEQGAQVEIKAELALTDKQRQKGLMFREHLAEDAGMMFFWEAPQQIFMWMKNTLIPLDMIFIRGDEIVGIVKAENTENTTPLTVPARADKILEVNYGFTGARGIEKGWRVETGPCISP